MLIFVFAGISSGLSGVILAEFAVVPNVQSDENPAALVPPDVRSPAQVPTPAEPVKRVEIGGPEGPEPTRFGDWERNGRCVDF
jgi:hypothetical protein